MQVSRARGLVASRGDRARPTRGSTLGSSINKFTTPRTLWIISEIAL
jgi:hypothetical protein